MRSEPNGKNAFNTPEDGHNTVATGQDIPSRPRSRIIPQMRRLRINPSQIFEKALDEKLESFSVVLNYKS